ncbi:MAG: hypothetical protein ACD_44C00214G0002, partial [uncultured bacterium]
AADVAKENYHLQVTIIEFSDYVIPNVALNDGSIDANMFQHAPYLKNAMQQHAYDFVAVAKTFIYPMGVYSKKINNLALLPDNAIVAIPNDPTNEARALLLLEKAGLIRLKEGSNENATLQSIVLNPKHLKIKEMDAASLPRVLDDTTLAVINTNYAIPAGLVPNKDALLLEDKGSLYANLLVVNKKDVSSKKIEELIKALHSEAVKEKANDLFQGQAVSAW